MESNTLLTEGNSENNEPTLISDGCKNTSWETNESYEVSKGLKQVFHGNIYQLKYLMLYAWKGSTSADVHFRLATEMEAAEKFDDLIFRTNINGQLEYTFLQIKHSQHLNDDTKIKLSFLRSCSDDGPYSLQKYFISYIKDMQHFKDGECKEFLICTNNSFNFDGNNSILRSYLKPVTRNDKILNLGGKCFQFSKDAIERNMIISEFINIFKDSLKLKIPSHSFSKQIMNDFFDILVFVTEQPSDEILSEIIKKEICNEFNLINEFTYSSFLNFMIDWMKHRDSCVGTKGIAHFLTDKDMDIFTKKAKENIAQMAITGIRELYERKFKKYKLQFIPNDPMITDIKKFLDDKSHKVLLIKQQHGRLSSFKVWQVLSNANFKSDTYIFSDLNTLSQLIGSTADPLKAFRSTGTNLLVLEHNSVFDKNAEEVINEFIKIINDYPEKQMIIITYRQNIDNFLQGSDSKVPHGFVILKNDVDSHNLTNESLNSFLKSKECKFQGYPVKLQEIMGEQSNQIINAQILSTLLENETIEIGTPRPTLSDLESFYCTKNKIVQKVDFLKTLTKNSQDLFVMAGTNEDLNSESVSQENIVFLSQQYDKKKILEKFRQKCRENDKKAVHLIDKVRDDLIWKHSFDASLYIPRNIYPVVINTVDLIKEIEQPAEKGQEKKHIFAIISTNCNIYGVSDKIISNIEDIKTEESSEKNNYIIKLNDNNTISDIRLSELKLYYFIHYLQVINDKLIWKSSEGDISKIREIQDKNNAFTFSEKELYEFSDTSSIIVIAAEPGMGKTTTFMQLMKENKDEWIIKINLIRMQKHLVNVTVLNSVEEVIDNIFAKADIGVNTDIAKCLLKHRIEQGGISLFFNGFDEITSKNQDVVIQLLNCLKNTKAKSWISTGLNVKDKLEKALSVISYMFKSIEDQTESFLNVLCKANLKFTCDNELSEESFLESINKMLLYVNNNKKSIHKNLMHTPLIIKMFSEIYYETVNDFNRVDTQDMNTNRYFILDLFDKFVQNKYKIYFQEKTDIHSIPTYLQNILTNFLNNDHQQIAFQTYVFPECEEENVLGDLNKLVSSTDDLKLVGLIQSADSKSDYSFIHTTFAEYFAAGHILNLLTRKKHLNFLLRKLFLIRNKVIYKFLKDMIDRKQDDNLSSKWKELLDHNLSTKTTQHSKIILYDDNREHLSLRQLMGKVKSCMKPRGSNYYYSGDPKLISKLCERFLNESNVSLLRETLLFLQNSYRESYYGLANAEFDKNDNIYLALSHYLSKLEIKTEDDHKIISDFITKQDNFVFFVNHPVTKENVQDIESLYTDKSYMWLQSQGIRISKCLQIITPKISRIFCSVLDNPKSVIDENDKDEYAKSVFELLIVPILTGMNRYERLPFIHTLSFMELVVRFTDYRVKRCDKIKFQAIALSTIFEKLIYIIPEIHTQKHIVLSARYLFLLEQVGFKLIDTNSELLILDPASEFNCTLINSKDQIVKTIKWMIEHPEENFNKNGYKDVFFKPRSEVQKRKYSLDENHFQVKKSRKSDY